MVNTGRKLYSLAYWLTLLTCTFPTPALRQSSGHTKKYKERPPWPTTLTETHNTKQRSARIKHNNRAAPRDRWNWDPQRESNTTPCEVRTQEPDTYVAETGG